jgi:LL-diaminopimelate aminotransferase
VITCSEKLDKLPPYIFTRIKALAAQAAAKKLDVIDLGMGNPDTPTPAHIVDRLVDTVKNHPRTHRYPQAKGMPRFRKAVASWTKKRFGVTLDADSEILSLVGSKEGVAHLCAAYLDPGDVVLVPVPTYPVHLNGVYLAGGTVQAMPLTAENKFLPDYGKVPKKALERAKLMFLNYPNNPTAAVVEDPAFFKETIRFAKKNDILVCYDNPYCELTFDGYEAPSILQFDGAKDVALEFNSFSKTYSMAGWRIGWACGEKKLLGPLEKFKSFVDYGAPSFIQMAAVAALEGPQDCVKELVKLYQRRRDYFVGELNKIGWPTPLPKATMYVWTPLPDAFKKMGSLAFAEKLVEQTGVVCTPGVGFGAEGEGYVRFSLVTHDDRFYDAILRIKKFLREAQGKPAPKAAPRGAPK